MRKAATDDTTIVVDYVRMQLYLVDEAMFEGFKDAKRALQEEKLDELYRNAK
jgi:hypothetical protein